MSATSGRSRPKRKKIPTQRDDHITLPSGRVKVNAFADTIAVSGALMVYVEVKNSRKVAYGPRQFVQGGNPVMVSGSEGKRARRVNRCSFEEPNSRRETAEILADTRLMAGLRRSEKDVARGDLLSLDELDAFLGL